VTEYSTYKAFPTNIGEPGRWSLLDLGAERST
jgi:hypothetical protein